MKVKAKAEPVGCVILAAGKGTRMKSKRHKVMHEVAHKPMLFHVIDAARALKPERIVTVIAPEMSDIRTLLRQNYKDVVNIAVQQEQRGTGDAVRSATSAMRGFDGIVVILYGDAPLVRPETITKVVTALRNSPEAGLAVLGMEVNTPNDYGRLVTGAKGALERIVEARDANETEKAITLCNSGIMAVRSKLLFSQLAKLLPKNAKNEYYLTDLVGVLCGAGHGCTYAKAEASELLGVNSRTELAAAEASIQQRLRKAAMESGVTLVDPSTVYLATDTKIGRDTVIHPHVIFGPGAEIGSDVEIRSFSHIAGAKVAAHAIIGPFARLRPGASIGEHAHVGNFVEIKEASLKRGAKVNHLTYIGDATVGEAANIGAGTITANYDGFHKHRTTIGANASIGSNTVLVAPVSIGEGAVIGAGSVITQNVEAESLALARGVQQVKPGWARNFRRRKQH